MSGRAKWVAVLAAMTCLLGACSSTPRMGQYTFAVSMDESMKDGSGAYQTVEVDLIGVSEMSMETWRGMKVDTYMQPGNAMRQAASARRKTLYFSNADDAQKEVYHSDAIWNQWARSKATSVFVIALMAMDVEATGAGTDPRIIKVPLTTEMWKNRQRIEFQVSAGGVVMVSAPKPPKR